jgi:CheY-like chemotaxis protein
MGGEIGVQSILGEGATFWFTTKLEKQSKVSEIAFSNQLEKLTGVRVLVVDDNATNRSIVHHLILHWKMRNGMARNGVEALEILTREALASDPYEVVIMDMAMPEMSGLELASAIKSNPLLQKTHIVMMTSLEMKESFESLRKIGVDVCLLKPVKQSRLFDCLIRVVVGETEKPVAYNRRSTDKLSENKLHILVAEDNIINQKVVLALLKKSGHLADTVSNGFEVLDALEKMSYDLILMDCQMPGMNGFETTRKIRKQEGATRHIPIIALTADALAGEREKCLKMGMDDYLSKPVMPKDLEKAIRNCTNKKISKPQGNVS